MDDPKSHGDAHLTNLSQLRATIENRIRADQAAVKHLVLQIEVLQKMLQILDSGLDPFKITGPGARFANGRAGPK